MPWSLRFRPLAEAEIEEAFEWYEARREGLGEEFLQEVQSTLLAVAEAPARFPKARGETRRAPVLRFPYSILFLLDQQEVVVVGCFHARRNPRRWYSRR